MKEEQIILFNEYKKQDLEPTTSFRIKTELESNIWDGTKIKSIVKNRVMDIVNEYISTIDIGVKFDIVDIIFIGSLASYNWSKYSDFDIHLVVDFSKINPNIKLVEEFFDAHRRIWNDKYDINIYKYEIELYMENAGRDMSHINGVYSLLKEKWIKKPSRIDFEPDEKLIERKSVDIMEDIDEVSEMVESKGLNDETQIEKVKKKIDAVWDDIKKKRKDGIESPEGEFAVGNLIFKYLRRNGYIGKTIEIKKMIVEKKYSVE